MCPSTPRRNCRRTTARRGRHPNPPARRWPCGWSGSKPPSSISLLAALPQYSLYASQAFARTVLPHVATGYVYFVRLHRGAADLPRFDAATSALGGRPTRKMRIPRSHRSKRRFIPKPSGGGSWPRLAALVGLVVIGQALGRQSIAESADFPTMVALGVERRQLVMLGTARNLVVGLVGALGAVLVATVLSPIAPLGEARVAESSTGINFDALVLIARRAGHRGGCVLVLGFWPAVRAARDLPVRRPDPRCQALGVGWSVVVARRTGERRDRRPQRASSEEAAGPPCRWAVPCSARCWR